MWRNVFKCSGQWPAAIHSFTILICIDLWLASAYRNTPYAPNTPYFPYHPWPWPVPQHPGYFQYPFYRYGPRPHHPYHYHHHPYHHYNDDYNNVFDYIDPKTHRNCLPVFFDSSDFYKGQGNVAASDASPVLTESQPSFEQNTNINQYGLLNAPDCGYVVNSENSSNGRQRYPWLSIIGYRNKTSNTIAYRCFGTIISELYILTAAHCLTNLDKDLEINHVRLGNIEISEECRRNPASCGLSQTYQIIDMIIHPQYNQPLYANDIALLRIEKPTIKYGTICLPLNSNGKNLSSAHLINQTGVVVSWRNDETGRTDHTLRYLQLKIQNTTQCAISYAEYSENRNETIIITPSELCAQGIRINDGDVCRGDSGGPLMDEGLSGGLFNTDGRHTLLGITAFGPLKCQLSSLPGVYTRIISFIDWMTANMR